MADVTKIPLSPAALPDPAHPSAVMFAAALGSFLATGVARVRRQPPNRVAEATAVGAFAGFGIGLAIYPHSQYARTHIIMFMDRVQRMTFVVAGSLTTIVLELALAFDWGQELTGWSVAAVVCGTYAVRARFFDTATSRSPSHKKQHHHG